MRVTFSVSSAVLPPSGLKAYFRPGSPLMANTTSLEMKPLMNSISYYTFIAIKTENTNIFTIHLAQKRVRAASGLSSLDAGIFGY